MSEKFESISSSITVLDDLGLFPKENMSILRKHMLNKIGELYESQEITKFEMMQLDTLIPSILVDGQKIFNNLEVDRKAKLRSELQEKVQNIENH